MAPRTLAQVLGLCNLVAGALLVCAPVLLLGDLEGTGTAAARLLSASAGVLLIAVGLGALRLPPNALRPYLWLFGVAVKVVAATVWMSTATRTANGALYLAAAGDGALALVIAASLWRLSPDERR